LVKETISMRQLLCALLLIPVATALASEDSLEQAMDIAIHGTKFQAERMTIAAENLANQSSTAMTPGGDPYRRKIVFAENKYDRKAGAHLVRVRKYGKDESPFQLQYNPKHPAADLNGYVKLPNVNPQIERADASEAQRTYEANLGIIEVSRSMMQKTIEAIK
jgi:flagellar basal-body rod protein FlgC